MSTEQSLPPTVLAQESAGVVSRTEDAIDSVFEPIAEFLVKWVFFDVTVFGATFPLIVGWLVLAGVVFTVYLAGIQFRGFGHGIQLARGKFSRNDDPGEVTHFQALSSAVSGTVGLGNIAGVALAVTLGGAGATFWMILAGLLGMCTKFVECTLGVKYRETHEDGTVSGGPFRYLPIAFARLKVPALGTALTGVFAVSIFFFGAAGGNMFQANQTYAQMRNVTGGDDGPLGSDAAALLFGIVLAVLVGLVIIGGIKSIGRVTSRLVPAMAALYVTACLFVILSNIGAIPGALAEIITGAFSPEGVAGGAVGVLIIGFQRAAFSNEAGIGSAAIAHSAVKTRHPVSEGFVALLEPFIDTVIICTMTALTIVIANPQSYIDARAEVAQTGSTTADGVVLTSDAFVTFLPWFDVLLAVAVALFAFSTLITWSYYTLKAWTWMFGRSPAKERTFQLIYCAFTVVGTVLTFEQVLGMADALLFVCALVNIVGLYLLAPVVKNELREYMAARRSGAVNANQKADLIA